jgi:DNA-binding response OmpR family regulator
MQSDRRAKIQTSLRDLAETYKAMMELMERTLALLYEDMAVDPHTYFFAHRSPRARIAQPGFTIDPGLFSVNFRGKACFLGDTYPFKFLYRLAQRPNIYVPYEDLLSEVWQGIRTESTVRSTAKVLRSKLRNANLNELAEAIDGTVPSHYSLKLVEQ